MDENFLDYIEGMGWAYEGAYEDYIKPETPVPDDWLLEEDTWLLE